MKKTEEDKKKTLGIGETAYINDKNGVKSMAITIDNVKLTDERNQFSEKEAEKVVVIEYTYENIAYEENLYVFDSNFKVYDASGNVLETYVLKNILKLLVRGKSVLLICHLP